MKGNFFNGLDSRQIRAELVRNEWLAHAAGNGRLCIIVGAGISIPFRVPSWPSLIKAIGGSLFLRLRDAGTLTAEQCVEKVINNKFNGDRSAFAQEIKRKLYARRPKDWSKFMFRPDLESLAMLCSVMVRKRPAQIISFNYDSYLGDFLSRRGFQVGVCVSESDSISNTDITILHPHGYLPFDGDSNTQCEPVVLDQASFHDSRMSAWWPICARIMSNCVCVFVGLSGMCPNQDYLVREIRKIRLKSGKSGYWGIALCEKNHKFHSWEDRGIYAADAGANFINIPSILINIIESIHY